MGNTYLHFNLQPSWMTSVHGRLQRYPDVSVYVSYAAVAVHVETGDGFYKCRVPPA